MKIKLLITALALSIQIFEFQTINAQTLRVLTGGIRNESNTFSTIQTKEANFKIKLGEAALVKQPWAEEFKKQGVEIIPTVHASSWPGGVVEKKTYDKLKAILIDGIKNAGKLDAIYLDMHGALHVEGYADAQLSLIEEIRAIVGKDMLIAASFDLHGNVSPGFVKNLNILSAFRTAPHRDMDSTKARTVRLLINALKKQQKPMIAQVVIPLLIPGEKGITTYDPLKSIYEKLPEISKQAGILDASIFVGYAWADVPRAAMSVEVVAENPKDYKKAKKLALALANEIWEARTKLHFEMITGTADEIILKAMKDTTSTVFITDSGDNTTGGAAGDSPIMLQRLLANKAQDVVYGGIFDSTAVTACEKAGVGQTINLNIGGKIDYVFAKPFNVTGKIIYLTPDSLKKTDKRAAVIQIENVTLVLLGVRKSFTDPKDFYNVNIKPLDHKIVVVKLGYLYPELNDIAPKFMMALTPGFCYQILEDIDYKNVKRPIYPLDKNMKWKAKIE